MNNQPSNLYTKIEAPISAFNNIMLEITRNIDSAVYPNVSSNGGIYNDKSINKLNVESNIFFIDNTINIMGYISIFSSNNEMLIKTLKPLNKEALEILNNIYMNYSIVSDNFFRYLMMYNRIAKSFDEVPVSLINTISENIKYRNFTNASYLLPYKRKLSKLDLELCDSFYTKNEYVIKFQAHSRNKFSYTIFSVISSDLNENKSLANIRFLETNILKKDTINYGDTENFINQLFCYGNIIKS